MLSEKRVRHMTQMAMREEGYGRGLGAVLRYRKGDYLTLCTIGGFFSGTLLYFGICMAAAFLVVSAWMVNLQLAGLLLGLLLILVCYILFMYYYLRLVRRRAGKRYDDGMEEVRQMRKDYKILREMYQEEDLSKIPEGWD